MVSTISDLTPSYLSKYSSFDLSKVSTKLTSNKDSFIFLPFVPLTTLLDFTHRMKVLGLFTVLHIIYNITED